MENFLHFKKGEQKGQLSLKMQHDTNQLQRTSWPLYWCSLIRLPIVEGKQADLKN